MGREERERGRVEGIKVKREGMLEEIKWERKHEGRKERMRDKEEELWDL